MIFKLNKNNLIYDKGWLHQNHLLTKTLGHSTTKIDLNELTISIDRWHFPLYKDSNNFFSSFPFENFHLIPYDHHVIKGEIIYNQNNTVNFVQKTITCDQYCDFVIESVSKNLKDHSYIIGNSNGLDCTTIMAIMDYYNIKYHTYDYNKRQIHSDKFFIELQKNHWGFNQTPYFEKTTSLVTGMYGDEYMLRNPLYVQWLLEKENLSQIFSKYPESYMYDYFFQYYDKKINAYPYNKNFLQHILNDYQLWSHNYTNIVCPFKDKNILLYGLNLDQDTIVKQVTDGFINKQIIKKCNKNLLSKLDRKKNLSDKIF